MTSHGLTHSCIPIAGTDALVPTYLLMTAGIQSSNSIPAASLS